MINLKELLPYYPTNLHHHAKGILREYLQCKILGELYKHPFAKKLCFIGGTCLRLVYRSHRFSEDLDFDNMDLTESEFEAMTLQVQKTLELEGYSTEIKHVYKGAFHCSIKIPKILYENALAPMENEKIIIKIDTVGQGLGYIRDTHLLSQFDMQHGIVVAPKSILVTMKLFACFNRVKGRDLYDLAFLRGQGIQPDWNILTQKLGIHNREQCKEQLLTRIQDWNLEQMNTDVSPFLFDPSNQAVKMFRTIIENVRF